MYQRIELETILQITFSNALSLTHNVSILIEISLMFVFESFGDKSVLVQTMAWCKTGDKPLPGLMLPLPTAVCRPMCIQPLLYVGLCAYSHYSM